VGRENFEKYIKFEMIVTIFSFWHYANGKRRGRLLGSFDIMNINTTAVFLRPIKTDIYCM
jgi:hypothetical protein